MNGNSPPSIEEGKTDIFVTKQVKGPLKGLASFLLIPALCEVLTNTLHPTRNFLILAFLSNCVFVRVWYASTCSAASLKMDREKLSRASLELVSFKLGVWLVSCWKGKCECRKKVRKNGECFRETEVVEFIIVWKSGSASCHRVCLAGELSSFF